MSASTGTKGTIFQRMQRFFTTHSDMTQGSPTKAIVMFTIPLLIGNLIQQTYNIVDAIIVGQYIGKEALAAVNNSFSIINLMLVLFMGFSTGASVLLAQYFGAKDNENLKRTVGTTMAITAVVSIVTLVTGVLVARPLLILINTPADILEMSSTYLIVIFICIPAIAYFNMISGVLRALGDSFNPLIFLIISSVINIILVIMFITVFDWGIGGVAWATGISWVLAAVFAWFTMQRQLGELRVTWKDFRIHIPSTKRMIQIGLPGALQQMSVSFAFMLVQSLINSFGTVIVASSGVVMRVDALVVMPMFSFSMAISTYVGQNIGSKSLDRIKKGIRTGAYMAFGTTVVLSLLLVVFGRYIMMLFTPDMEVVDTGYMILTIIAPFYWVWCISAYFGGVLRGAGKTFVVLMATLAGTVVGRTGIAYFLVNMTQTHIGLWWSSAIGWVIGSVVVLAYYLIFNWRKSAIDDLHGIGTYESLIKS